MTKFLLVIALALSIWPSDTLLHAQPKNDPAYKAADGTFKYLFSGNEITGFGVNYTVPFAHAYRMAQKMGIDLRQAIDQDVYHFYRLGLDLYRVHVWDCEISDTLGNLIDNEHLELFDYLLFKLQERNINAIITPIAYWGNGWPEPDEPTPGFSTKYGKDKCLTDPAAIRAQQNYLAQFVNHINRYTGVAYKDDARILAFEISNEPHHRGTPEEVTQFVKSMKSAIASTGCTKPVLYNVSHSVHLAEAYYDAGIDGGTFQWYPTGLGYQKELGGNLLPNVDRYTIPFDQVMVENGSARIVYEFDAADMATTVMYPAMARSFRTAGIQLATHFSYDPTFLAPYNTEYNTHYMNLVYAPRKALALMICGEIFRTIPRGVDFGLYPKNTSFGPFRIDYASDLAEMITPEKFYYTHHTSSSPDSLEQLKHIAGWGNSPVVQYEGTGAYFLDKIGNGLWMLEVLPDAIHVDNLFGRNSPDKTLAVLQFNTWPMSLHLPDLEKGFVVLNTKTEAFIDAQHHRFSISPGKYMIMSIDFSQLEISQYDFPTNESLAESCVDGLHPTLTRKYVLHQPLKECTSGVPQNISAVIASPTMPDSVDLWYYHQWNPVPVRMRRVHGYTYEADIPGDHLIEGPFSYWITTYFGQTPQTYPSGKVNKPGDWNFDQTEAYSVRCVSPKKPIHLFDVHSDVNRLNRLWQRDSKIIPGKENGDDWLYVKVDKLVTIDPENPHGVRIADYSMRHYFGDLIQGRTTDLTRMKSLVLRAHALPGKACPIQVKLVMQDGTAVGAIVRLKAGKDRYEIPLKKFKPVRAVLLPRPYPTFLPYYSAVWNPAGLRLDEIESLQFSMGPGLRPEEINRPYEVMLRSVSLE